MNSKTKKMAVPGFIGVVVILLVASGVATLWIITTKRESSEEIRFVPGEFPKKVANIQEKVVDSDKSVPVQAVEPISYPIQLSNSEAENIEVVVNKKHKLPNDYVPQLVSIRGGQMRPEAAMALEDLLKDAENAKIQVKVISAYRSYGRQEAVYADYVASSGQEQADTFSARPGHSEHQTGLAVDVGTTSCDLLICFGNTDFGMWLKENSYKYGFIIRYADGKETVTGYQYEPWHLRYLGVDTATKVSVSELSLDEYFGVKAGNY